MANCSWFTTQKVHDWLYLTKELDFSEGYRCNIWLIKGPSKDVVIDTGLGVCSLHEHFQSTDLLSPGSDCIVICTHCHYDHSGGAQHFESVFVHENDADGLRKARQTETLNYVKESHFLRQPPYPGFSARRYQVPPTNCLPLKEGQLIDIGGGQSLQIMHVPGHTTGSIAVYYPNKSAVFTGDFLYDSGDGTMLIDWLPTSSISQYKASARMFLSWLSDHRDVILYPGHYNIINSSRGIELLQQYLQGKSGLCGGCCSQFMQCATFGYFLCGCFRCGC